jgi:hypothetical protein
MGIKKENEKVDRGERRKHHFVVVLRKEVNSKANVTSLVN